MVYSGSGGASGKVPDPDPASQEVRNSLLKFSKHCRKVANIIYCNTIFKIRHHEARVNSIFAELMTVPGTYLSARLTQHLYRIPDLG